MRSYPLISREIEDYYERKVHVDLPGKRKFKKGEFMNEVDVSVKVGATYLPEYKTNLSAAADVYTTEEKIIPAKGTEVFSTGLFMRPTAGYCIRVLSRSGMAFKHGIFVLNADGLIDEDYSDEIKIILANFGDEPYLVREGDRIAQFKLEKVERMSYTLVERLPEISSNRDGGMGSTGR